MLFKLDQNLSCIDMGFNLKSDSYLFPYFNSPILC